MKTSTLSGGLLALALALPLAACSGADGAAEEGNHTPLDVDHVGEAGPLGQAPTGRWTKRVTVDMLQASVPVVAGSAAGGTPIRWAVDYKGNLRDGFDQRVFGGTLGRADYHNVTEENTVPSSLYAKLVDDMAKNVCGQMVEADLAQPGASERVLTRFAGAGSDKDVAVNIRYLTLRFHGESLAEDDAQVVGLAKLYRDVADAAGDGEAANPAMEGWRAVCIALVSSPAFHMY